MFRTMEFPLKLGIFVRRTCNYSSVNSAGIHWCALRYELFFLCHRKINHDYFAGASDEIIGACRVPRGVVFSDIPEIVVYRGVGFRRREKRSALSLSLSLRSMKEGTANSRQQSYRTSEEDERSFPRRLLPILRTPEEFALRKITAGLCESTFSLYAGAQARGSARNRKFPTLLERASRFDSRRDSQVFDSGVVHVACRTPLYSLAVNNSAIAMIEELIASERLIRVKTRSRDGDCSRVQGTCEYL